MQFKEKDLKIRKQLARDSLSSGWPYTFLVFVNDYRDSVLFFYF